MKQILSVFFVIAFSCLLSTGYCQPVNDPSTALQRYLNNGDNSYSWTLRDSLSFRNIKAYFFELRSQKWQGITWKHELAIVIPNKVKSDGVLLWVTGGDNKENGEPNFRKKTDGENVAMAQIAMENNSITAVLRQDPNQPLYNGLKEGELMVYSLHQYLDKKDDSWPVLFPMVKSAVKAMDLVQEFTKKRRNIEVSRFVVSGGSKRGWVSWMMGAIGDPRVVAIAPMVIDMLNMPTQLDRQAEVLAGERNEEVKAYTDLGISVKKSTPQGEAITRMIDPYAYRKNITVPKLLVMAGNDHFWTIDAFRFYESGLVGDYRLCYVPNVGHALGDKKQALGTLNMFFQRIIDKEPYPQCKWDIGFKKGVANLDVEGTEDGLLETVLWTAESATQDFRKSEWNKTRLATKKKAKVTAEVALPETGYKAFFVEMKYKNPQYPGSFTTRAYLVDKNGEVK